MKIKIFLIIIFLGSTTYNVNGQFKVSYILGKSRHVAATATMTDNSYSDMGNKIGVGYDINKIFSADAYFYSSQDYLLSPEVTVRVHFLNKDNYRLYAGAGVLIGWQKSLVFPVGVEVKPFNSYPKFSFRFDANVSVDLAGDNPPYLAPGLGICYSFGNSIN
ncbi:MAG: hypothetical protein LBR10_13610 [Prevotellaceae bacterium]|jgi:hypothetical protein|nr:hypothetical protein [Prevotellaceae bacterium]